MSKHAAPRRRAARPRRTGRIRALLSLGALLGLGAIGTTAFWTDTATLSTGEIKAGELDVGLDDTFLDGPGGTYANTAITVPNLTPGESIAFSVEVNNLGNAPLSYTATATASGNLATLNTPPVTSANRLQWTIVPGGTKDNQGSAAAGTRVGTCSGTASYGPGVLGASATTIVGTGQQVAVGSSPQNLCIRVSLPTTAPNALQNETATAVVTFNAKQVNAP